MQGVAHGILDALSEPALLLARSGVVRHANVAALRLLGDRGEPLVGRRLDELTADPPEAVAGLLRRFAGSARSMVGVVHLRDGTGGAGKHRCYGCRVDGAPDGAEPVLLLRLEDPSRDRFAALTDKIVALNAEIRHSKRIQQQLEVALEQKEILLRELHHRVKNNLQILLGTLAIAERRTTVPPAKEVLREVRLRVEAMAVLQRLLYRGEDLAGVDAAVFLHELCENVERAFHRPGTTVRVAAAGQVISLDLAAVLGLIVSELLTNAFKHAFAEGEAGTIRVELHPREIGPGCVLVVEDDGRGLAEASAVGTGLTLVQGLARQQGGSCRLEPAAGTRWVIELHDRYPRRAASAI